MDYIDYFDNDNEYNNEVRKLFTGREFNEFMKKYEKKVLLCIPHNNFEIYKNPQYSHTPYKLGINISNVDIEEMYKNNLYSDSLDINDDPLGGWIFYYEDSDFLRDEHCFIISIPDNASVKLAFAYRHDIFMSDIIEIIEEVKEEWYVKNIEKYPQWLKNIHIQSSETCMKAILCDPSTLKHVRDKTEKLCIAAINQDHRAIQFIENPSEDMIELASWLSYDE